MQVTITNNGQAPARIRSIGVSGEFSQTNNCPDTLIRPVLPP
jgi:hypothetical protein